jgi:hypothetical protein
VLQGELLGIAGKILGIAGRRAAGIANGGRGWRARAAGWTRGHIRRDDAGLGIRNQQIVTAAEKRG